MISKWQWILSQIGRMLWVRASLFALLGIGSALLATAADQFWPGEAPIDIAADQLTVRPDRHLAGDEDEIAGAHGRGQRDGGAAEAFFRHGWSSLPGSCGDRLARGGAGRDPRYRVRLAEDLARRVGAVARRAQAHV